MTVNDAAPDNLSQQPPSPRRENDSSPLPSNARQNLVGHAAAQDDEVAGFLFSRNLPETELRLASRFKDVDTDVSLCFPNTVTAALLTFFGRIA
jgi:hypothetical protein